MSWIEGFICNGADVSNYYTKTEISTIINNENVLDDEDLSNYFTKFETAVLLDGKADKANTYTKPETDNLLNGKVDDAELTNYSTTVQMNTALNLKADKATTYTKTETDTLLGAKVNNTTLANYSTTAQMNTALNLKADKATTYTKTETDTLLNGKVDDAELTNYSTTAQMNTALNLKADKTTTYTKTETNTLLNGKVDDAELTNYSTTAQMNTALNLKADKTTTYTKTETDVLLFEKADKLNTYSMNEVDNLLSTKLNLEALEPIEDELAIKADQETTYTKIETNALMEDILAITTTWFAPTITVVGAPERKFSYAVEYNSNFVDSTNDLEITPTSKAIVPAVKIYEYVQDVITGLPSDGNSVYYKLLTHTFTTPGFTGYYYYNITFTDPNLPAGKDIFIFKVGGNMNGGATLTNYEPVGSIRMGGSYGSNFQIGHHFKANTSYTFSGWVYYTYLTLTQSSATSSIAYQSNPVQFIQDRNPERTYFNQNVELEVIFSDTGALWKKFLATVVLELVKDNAYWCTVNFVMEDTIPGDRNNYMSVRMPFWTYELHPSTTPIIKRGSAHISLAGVSTDVNLVSLYTLPSHTTRRYNMFFMWENETYVSATTGTPKTFRATGSVRYLCDIQQNVYGLLL